MSWLTSVNSLNIITSNVKEIQTSKKRLKLIEYSKIKIGSQVVVFPQETHSSAFAVKQLTNSFSGPTFFAHGETNFCSV